MSIDCELKMQQNGILEAYILKFFPWEHAPRAPYRFAPSALVGAAMPPPNLPFYMAGGLESLKCLFIS